MKKHLVMIVGGYYPEPSPTGKVAEQYISLVQKEYDVEVLCIGKKHLHNYEYVHAGKKIHALANWRPFCEYVMQCKEESSTKKVRRNAFRFGKLLFKGIGWIQSKVLFPNNLRWYLKASVKELLRIHISNPIDILFSVAAPFSSHLACEEFRKSFPTVKWITYTVDSYAAQNKNTKRYRKAVLAEQKINKSADLNFLSAEILRAGVSFVEDDKAKVKELPYLLEINEEQETIPSGHTSSQEKIIVVYAGRFYPGLRDPDFMLKTFSKTKNIVLKIFTEGNCQSIVDCFCKKNQNISRYDMVPFDEINKVYSMADVLVSVGNNAVEFQPSKIYEYISLGMPIIHFYYKGYKDRVLERYPLSLQIEMDSEDAVDRINTFLQEFGKRRIPRSAVKDLFPENSPGFIRQQLLDVFSN